MPTLCNVTGELRDLEGNLLPNQALSLKRLGVLGQDGATVVPANVIVKSDAAGAVDVNVFPGVYVGELAVSNRKEQFGVSVPEAPTASLHNLIDQAGVELTPSLVAEALGYAERAETAAAAAVLFDPSQYLAKSDNLLGLTNPVAAAGRLGLSKSADPDLDVAPGLIADRATIKRAVQDLLPTVTTEADFTPEICTQSGAGYTYSAGNGSLGKYVRVGNLVHVAIQIRISADDTGKPSSTEAVYIRNLPFEPDGIYLRSPSPVGVFALNQFGQSVAIPYTFARPFSSVNTPSIGPSLSLIDVSGAVPEDLRFSDLPAVGTLYRLYVNLQYIIEV